jgi:hypothetical protein
VTKLQTDRQSQVSDGERVAKTRTKMRLRANRLLVCAFKNSSERLMVCGCGCVCVCVRGWPRTRSRSKWEKKSDGIETRVEDEL